MRKTRRFRPGAWDALEGRIVLSSVWKSPAAAIAPLPWWRGQAALQRPAMPARPSLSRPTPARPTPVRPVHQTPAVVIEQQYAAFAADFATAARAYLNTLAAGSQGGTVTVSTTLTAPYTPNSGVMAVADPTVFGSPTPAAPIVITALVDGAPMNSYQVTGVIGNVLTGVSSLGGLVHNPALPAGAVLQAQVTIPASPGAVADVAGQFQVYIAERTLQLSQELVTAFNRMPIRLPKLPGPYHTHRPPTAIQTFLANQIAGPSPTSLLQQLLALPLPTTTGSAVDLYIASASTVIASSEQQVREGVRLLFAGRDVLGLGLLTPAIPGQ